MSNTWVLACGDEDESIVWCNCDFCGQWLPEHQTVINDEEDVGKYSCDYLIRFQYNNDMII